MSSWSRLKHGLLHTKKDTDSQKDTNRKQTEADLVALLIDGNVHETEMQNLSDGDWFMDHEVNALPRDVRMTHALLYRSSLLFIPSISLTFHFTIKKTLFYIV